MSQDAPARPEYVLGTNAAELVRLGFQHQVWSEWAHGCWERAGFSRGMTVYDVGCGPGFGSLDIAHIVGPVGRVVAVDESAPFIEYLSQAARALGLNWIEPTCGDVQAFDCEPGSCDGAYARWVLCFVAEPAVVIHRISHALRRGGVVAIQDYSNYLGIRMLPPADIFDRIWQATYRSWKDRGGDPDIAIRLPRMLAAHGLQVESIRPMVRTTRPGTALWNWPVTFFANFLPVLVESGYLAEDDAHTFREHLEHYSMDENSVFQTPPMMEIIARKA